MSDEKPPPPPDDPEVPEVFEPPPRKGPKSLLTDEVQEQLVGLLQAGCYMDDAAGSLGISAQTVFGWMKRGKAAREAGKRNRYRTLLEAVEKARHEARSRLTTIVAMEAQNDGHLALEMLARMDPKRWAPRVTVTLAEEFNAAIARVEAEFANEPEILRRALHALAGTGGGSAAGVLGEGAGAGLLAAGTAAGG